MEESQKMENAQLKQGQSFTDKTEKPDMAEMMNHPDRYSEEELHAFFDDSETEENLRYVMLARMANKRKKATPPNVDQAWESFKPAMKKAEPKKKTMVWQMWGAALAGAAAMLVGVLVYIHYFASPKATEETVIAMFYDETPQHITLQHDEELLDLSKNDSLSFRALAKSESAERVASSSPTRSLTPKIQKLSTPRGMDFKVILPDGSEVWLNAESTIEFPAAFIGNERQVLLKGEAYFKVARDEDCPFVVISNQMKVRVLGTEFNFRSYTSEASHVSLIKGSVEILRPDAEKAEVVLEPGQGAWRDADGEIHVQEVDTYAVTQWVDGFFYFDDIPLVQILCELGRWYNLGVVFRNKSAMHAKMHFSASRNGDLEQTINNLNRMRKGRVSVEGTDIVVY